MTLLERRRQQFFRAKSKEQIRLRWRARAYVRECIKKGTLKRQPCEVCGTTINVHAHHVDYRDPLKILWLCGSDHAKEHMKSGDSQYNQLVEWRAWVECPKCGGKGKYPDGSCRNCKLAYVKDYYAKNRKRILEAKWRRDHDTRTTKPSSCSGSAILRKD